jgi:hypothetical protein
MNDSDQFPTPLEFYHAEEKAVRLGLMKRNADGTCSITDEGIEWVENWVLEAPTIH